MADQTRLLDQSDFDLLPQIVHQAMLAQLLMLGSDGRPIDRHE